jgi:hypothetical protein
LVTVLRSDFATDNSHFIPEKSPLAISGLYNRKAPGSHGASPLGDLKVQRCKKESPNTYEDIYNVISNILEKKITKEHLTNYLKHSYKIYK